MAKMTVADLAKIKGEVKRSMDLRTGEQSIRVIVHMGTCGIAAGARDIMKTFMEEVETRKLEDVALTASGCAGLCSKEPMITVEKGNEPAVKYAELTPEKAREIVEHHIVDGRVLEDYALGIGHEQAY